MATLHYTFEIPDPSRPIADSGIGPSGELIPFVPEPLDAASVVGRRIDDVSCSVGTYGMGGAGFFGLRLGSEWLVIAIWGAGAWMMAEGRLVEDIFFDTRGRARPWMDESGDELLLRVARRTISGIQVERDAMRITLDDGFCLYIESDASSRPIFEGNKTPRAFGPDDDLRRAVFLSPTDELWV